MNADCLTAQVDDTAEEFDAIGEARYSVEDNKIRIYPFARLDTETYERVQAAGYQWAKFQECFVAPRWTPEREDIALELCGEIGDEDYSATERAADRAERFGGYRDKREAEATASADKFDTGPQAFGHQSRARAERQARRHERKRTYAVSQWSKAEYWQSRTEGVISNVLYKQKPAVRRGRIKELEADQRKHEKGREEYATRYAQWSAVATMEGADRTGEYETESDRCGFKPESVTPALKLANYLVNYGTPGDYTHPRTGKVSSLYYHLTDKTDPITPAEASALWLAGKPDPERMGKRWSDHYANRLAYEKAMLANEGGMAADVEMIVGGWINTGNTTGSIMKDVALGWKQIHAVTRSTVTKKITSVKVMGTVGYRDPKPGLVSVNVERLGEGNYRAPTPEELAAFLERSKIEKADKKSSTPKAPALINPTDADAEKLQAIWNEQAAKKGGKPVSVLRITQAQYSHNSKGDSSVCSTSEVDENLAIRRYGRGGRVCVFKVRTADPGGFSFKEAQRVVVLTDKPQKPLPWVAIQVERSKHPTAETLFDKLGEIAAELEWKPGEGRHPQILLDAEYLGWVSLPSLSQRQWTNEGVEQFKKWKAINSGSGTLVTV